MSFHRNISKSWFRSYDMLSSYNLLQAAHTEVLILPKCPIHNIHMIIMFDKNALNTAYKPLGIFPYKILLYSILRAISLVLQHFFSKFIYLFTIVDLVRVWCCAQTRHAWTFSGYSLVNSFSSVLQVLYTHNTIYAKLFWKPWTIIAIKHSASLLHSTDVVLPHTPLKLYTQVYATPPTASVQATHTRLLFQVPCHLNHTSVPQSYFLWH